MRKILFIFISTLLVIAVISCDGSAFIRKDGPYEGRIIDADTGQPIEGVVVLGVWYREHPGPGGAVSEYYDAMETITDKNGEFKIKGLGLLVMSNILPMDVLIFKAGYTHYGLMTWRELKGLYKTQENRAMIRLKKLTMEARKKRLIGKESIPDNKQTMLIRELNQEKKELGKSLYQEVE